MLWRYLNKNEVTEKGKKMAVCFLVWIIQFTHMFLKKRCKSVTRIILVEDILILKNWLKSIQHSVLLRKASTPVQQHLLVVTVFIWPEWCMEFGKTNKKSNEQSMNDTLDFCVCNVAYQRQKRWKENQYSTVNTKSEDGNAKIQGWIALYGWLELKVLGIGCS